MTFLSRRLRRRWLFPALIVTVGFAALAGRSYADDVAGSDDAAEPSADAEPVSYYNDVRPIFQQHCQGCHQPAKASGEYVMVSHDALLAAGESGEVGVVPGDPEASELLRQITPNGDDPPAMPKDREPLSADQIELVRLWIATGAVDDSPPSNEPLIDAAHPPVYLQPPVITSLAYSPDGTLLAVSAYHEVILLNADNGERVARLVGVSERIESIAFSPDGSRIAITGGSPGLFGEIQVWNTASRELEMSLPVTYDTLYGAAWSPDGKLISFGCADNTVRAIDATTGERRLYQGAHSDWVLDTDFSTDGSHLVSVSRDRSMKLTEVATQRFIDNITSITPGALKGGLIAVERRPEKDELLVGGADGAPKLYQMYRTQKRVIGDDFNLIRAFEPLPGRVMAVQFNQDGSRFVAASSAHGDGAARVYQTDDGAVVSRFAEDRGPLYAAAFRCDVPQVTVGGLSGTVSTYNADTGELIREFMPVPISDAASLATGPAADATAAPQAETDEATAPATNN
ncbi:MAG: c-type cytochrome domain-containing protein [Pirellulales bacterium]